MSTRGVSLWGLPRLPLCFQFPVLSRIRAQEAEALRKGANRPLWKEWAWTFLPFSPVRAPLRDPPPIPIALRSGRVGKAEISAGGKDGHLPSGSRPLGWPSPSQPTSLSKCRPGST